jgi:hypothetical protein
LSGVSFGEKEMMKKRHYNAIAAALYSGKASTMSVTDIAKVLLDANKNFDLDKFLDKAFNGPSMEKRAAQYRAHLKRMERWQQELAYSTMRKENDRSRTNHRANQIEPHS